MKSKNFIEEAVSVGVPVILVIIYVETFKSDVIVFISNLKCVSGDKDQTFPVSDLVCWYWKYYSSRSEKNAQMIDKIKSAKIEKVGLFTNKKCVHHKIRPYI